MEREAYLALLHQQLLGDSFQEVADATGVMVKGLYLRIENPVCYIVLVHEEAGWAEKSEGFRQYLKKITDQRDRLYCTHVVGLDILIGQTDNPIAVEDEVEALHRVHWVFSPEEQTLRVGKDEPDKLLGIEERLLGAARGERGKQPLAVEEEKQGGARVCGAILFLCLLFWALTKLGDMDVVLRQFGLSRVGIERGELYRFVTAIFLHMDVTHLASNGVYLYYFGMRAEKVLGSKKFLLLYLLSGLCGGICSVAFQNITSIGASGAIYGLIGAMFLLTKEYGPRYTGMNYGTMLLLVIVSLGQGFLQYHVDVFAHIGGFVGGVLFMLIFLWRTKKAQRLG